jgi:hypothetical protein
LSNAHHSSSRNWLKPTTRPRSKTKAMYPITSRKMKAAFN